MEVVNSSQEIRSLKVVDEGKGEKSKSDQEVNMTDTLKII